MKARILTIISLLLLTVHAREPLMIDPTTGATGQEYTTINFTATAVQVNGAAIASLDGGTFTDQIEFSGTDHAGIVLINLTTAERDALSASNGMIIYNTTTGQFEGYDSAWAQLGGGTGTMTSIKSNNVAVGDADIVTLDFSSEFGAAETPDTEIQITIDASITRDTEWDTAAKINAATTDEDFLVESDIGGTVQAYDAILDDISAVSPPTGADEVLVSTGAGTFALESGATLRTSLGVDAAGTDNSTNVTLAGTPDYITLAGQVLTRNQIDLTADVTGSLPDANVANDLTLAGATIGTSAITLVQSTNPTPTAEGVIEWDSDDHQLKIGDGATTISIGAGGGGNVSNTGTPSDGQIAVWTNATTIEGDSGFSFDTSGNILSIDGSGNIEIGGAVIIDDVGGTTTLGAIDAIDATTETTLEAAIDSLVNLTVVGTIATGTWQGTVIDDAYIDNSLALDSSGNINQTPLTLNQNTAPTPTSEGLIQWDTDDDRIVVGNGTAALTFSDDSVMVNDSEIGTTVQAYDADLDDLADGSLSASKIPNADDDGTTKGVATFNDTDFNATTGVVTLARGEYDFWELGAGAFSARTTNGAEKESKEHPTNDVQVDVWKFDAATDEAVFVQFPTPGDWDGGTIKAKVFWDAAGTGNVVWEVAARAYGDSDAIDQAFTGGQTVTDAKLTTLDMHISTATAAITVQGSPAGGEFILIRVLRDADNGSDTLTGDAELYGILVQYRKSTSATAAW